MLKKKKKKIEVNFFYLLAKYGVNTIDISCYHLYWSRSDCPSGTTIQFNYILVGLEVCTYQYEALLMSKTRSLFLLALVNPVPKLNLTQDPEH